ncbi:MAG: DUF3899 domain-containing protein [Candidatus Izemoplasmatales bacterium]
MRPFRPLLILAATLGLALGVHLLVYGGDNFTYESMSNALFVVGMIIFLPSLVVLTRAYEVFQGIQYSMRVLFSPNYRKLYPKYSDYKEEKSEKIKTTIFYEILGASLVVVVIAIVLAQLV